MLTHKYGQNDKLFIPSPYHVNMVYVDHLPFVFTSIENFANAIYPSNYPKRSSLMPKTWSYECKVQSIKQSLFGLPKILGSVLNILNYPHH
jgi:hypothetical protein